jgi:hypothetical protein
MAVRRALLSKLIVAVIPVAEAEANAEPEWQDGESGCRRCPKRRRARAAKIILPTARCARVTALIGGALFNVAFAARADGYDHCHPNSVRRVEPAVT